MGKFLLLVLSFSFSIASSGQMNTIYYGIDLKTAQEPDSIYSTNNEIITHAFAPLDSLVLDSIVKAYLNVLFADSATKCRSAWGLSSPYYVIKILEPTYEIQNKWSKPNILSLKEDTIFIDEQPYVERNGDFDLSVGKQSFIDDSITVHHNLIRDIAGLHFTEEWTFTDNSFHKEIKKILPLIAYNKKLNDSLVEHRRKLFSIPTDTAISNSNVLLHKDVVYDVFVLHLRHSSLHFTKRNKIILDILKAAKNGSIQAYSVELDSTSNITFPDLNTPLSYDEMIHSLSYSYADTTISHNTLEHIVKFRFYEDWFFSPETFSFSKKVKGIGFILGGKPLGDNCSQYSFMQEKVYFKLD